MNKTAGGKNMFDRHNGLPPARVFSTENLQ